jgi:hypothetical protein
MAASRKSNEFIAFGWVALQDGYEWIDAHEVYMPPRWGKGWAPAERWLILRPEAQNRKPRRYNPLEEKTSLFRTFAETPLTEEGILQFTNQYGCLGVQKWIFPREALAFALSEEGQKLMIKDFSTGILGPNRGISGESLEMWEQSIRHMRFALTLWEAIRSKDVGQLRRFILFQEGSGQAGGFIYRSREEVGDGYETGVIDETAHDIPTDARALLKPRNVIHLALVVVQTLANKQLWTHAGPCLLYGPPTLRDGLRAEELPQNRLHLRIVPKNLLGAIWLQYARGIDGNKDYRRCRACGKWFEISLEANRPTRFFCEDACRYKVYRERIAAAQKLHFEGVSIEVIAQHLETDTATVEGWIVRPAHRQRRAVAHT